MTRVSAFVVREAPLHPVDNLFGGRNSPSYAPVIQQTPKGPKFVAQSFPPFGAEDSSLIIEAILSTTCAGLS